MRNFVRNQILRQLMRMGVDPSSPKGRDTMRRIEDIYDAGGAIGMTVMDLVRRVLHELSVDSSYRDGDGRSDPHGNAGDDPFSKAQADYRKAKGESAQAKESRESKHTGDSSQSTASDISEPVCEKVQYDGAFGRLAPAINACMWLFTVAVFVILGMATGAWHITWLMFISAAIGSVIIDMLVNMEKGCSLKQTASHLQGVVWLAAVLIFFLGLFIFRESSSWMVFFVAALISVVLSRLK